MKISENHEIGRAAEHLVVADLILQGVPAVIIPCAWPFDILATIGTQPYRVQVKSTGRARNFDHAKDVYRFSLRSGKGSMRAIAPGSIDVMAFVALDLRRVAYFHVRDLLSRNGSFKQTVDLRLGELHGRVYATGRQRTLTWHQRFNGHESFLNLFT